MVQKCFIVRVCFYTCIARSMTWPRTNFFSFSFRPREDAWSKELKDLRAVVRTQTGAREDPSTASSTPSTPIPSNPIKNWVYNLEKFSSSRIKCFIDSFQSFTQSIVGLCCDFGKGVTLKQKRENLKNHQQLLGNYFNKIIMQSIIIFFLIVISAIDLYAENHIENQSF